MLLTNLLLACGLSTAVGSGLVLKENSNYLYHEKPQEQLHLDNKKNAVTGNIELNTWYSLPLKDYSSSLDIYCTFDFNYDYLNLVNCNELYIDTDGPELKAFDNSTYLSLSIDDMSGFCYVRFSVLPTETSSINDLNSLKSYLTLSDNQNIGGSTTEEVFDVVGDTTTGFIDVLTSAIEDGTELIYNNGNFTFLGVMLLIATGISVVFWIFRLLRGITEGVSR